MKYFGHDQDVLLNKVALSYWTNWKVNEEAGTYNEALFQKLHEEHSARYNRNDDEFEGIIPHSDNFDFLDNYMNGFYQICPQEILNLVADKRVLALGTLTKETLAAIIKVSEEATRQLELRQKEYKSYYDQAVQMLSAEGKFVMGHTFHDSKVLQVGWDEKNPYLLIRLCNGSDKLEDQYLKIIFINGVVVQGTLDSSLQIWIYEELYYKENHFELQIRFLGGDIILHFDDIKSETVGSFLTCDYLLPELEHKDITIGTRKELIELGKMNIDDIQNNPWIELMSEEDAMNLEIMHIDNMDDIGALAISKVSPDFLQGLTERKFCYQINFTNEWMKQWNLNAIAEESPEVWVRGTELLDYIKKNCPIEFELWIIWSNHKELLQYQSYSINDLDGSLLSSFFQEVKDGIITNRCISMVE